MQIPVAGIDSGVESTVLAKPKASRHGGQLERLILKLLKLLNF